MKTVKDIEKEYEGYTKKTDVVTNLDEFLSFIEIGIDDTDEYKKDYVQELKKCKKWKTLAQFYNFFFFMFAEADIESFDMEIDIIKKCITYTDKIGEYFRRIESSATEQNYEELTRLVDFITDYYSSQTDYYDYQLQQLDKSDRGIGFNNPNYGTMKV